MGSPTNPRGKGAAGADGDGGKAATNGALVLVAKFEKHEIKTQPGVLVDWDLSVALGFIHCAVLKFRSPILRFVDSSNFVLCLLYWLVSCQKGIRRVVQFVLGILSHQPSVQIAT